MELLKSADAVRDRWVERESKKPGGISSSLDGWLNLSFPVGLNPEFWVALQSIEYDGWEVSAKALNHSWLESCYGHASSAVFLPVQVETRSGKVQVVRVSADFTYYASRWVCLLNFLRGDLWWVTNKKPIGKVEDFPPELLYHLWRTRILSLLKSYLRDNRQYVDSTLQEEFKGYCSKAVEDSSAELGRIVQTYIDTNSFFNKIAV